MSRKRILSQMFDVRPVLHTGDLDWKKINGLEKILKIKYKKHIPSFKTVKIKKFKISEPERETPIIKKSWQNPERKINYKKEEYYHILRPISPGNAFSEKQEIAAKEKTAVLFSPKTQKKEDWHFIKEKSQSQPANFHNFKQKSSFSETFKELEKKLAPEAKEAKIEKCKKPETAETKNVLKKEIPAKVFGPEEEVKFDDFFPVKEEEYIKDDFGQRFNLSDLFTSGLIFSSFNSKFKKNILAFAGAVLAIFLVIGGFSFYHQTSKMKNEVLGVSSEGLKNLESAIENIKNNNLDKSKIDFQEAYQYFSEASASLGNSSGFLAEISHYIPLVSQFSSGKYAIEAGRHIALAGNYLNKVIIILNKIKNPLDLESEELSMLEAYRLIEKDLQNANQELKIVEKNINKINIDDLPADKRNKFLEVKQNLPAIIAFSDNFLSNNEIFVDLLGGNGPRKYLFLFQNNQEMRPTGGFIGSYGILDIKDGRIRKFMIDGIFNPDGQLAEKIVPPNPIMKISAAWSLHDSNWWPDFPRSAQKAMFFYEKTGGPTIDGIITFTPAVMQKFLEITGPIEMSEYGVTLTADNFVEKTQYEVEVDYDKEENQPKKILADLAPIVLDRIFNKGGAQTIFRTISIINQELNQKQILLYSQNPELQKLISALGWSGEVLKTSKDYLQVVNTNINGYKTDGVIDEEIKHEAEIQNDGSIIDTVIITRYHKGGDSQYEWWNKVNADYLRVYVPLGSQLISVEGQTREFTAPPLDYDALGFKRDIDVEAEEKNMNINQETGTRIYEDSGKTVFANWTYVSPKETVVIKYKYVLPFKIKVNLDKDEGDAYSILFQKQSGSFGSKLTSRIKYPENLKIAWKFPESLDINGEINYSSDLATDKFLGVVFAQE